MKICIKMLLNILLTLALITPCHAINKVKTLENLIQVAEDEFLDSDLSKAIQTYKAITNLALDEIWTVEIRANIFQSYFRLAQLDKTKEIYWIKKAIVFAPDLKPNLDLTPLNLVQIYEAQIQMQSYTNLKAIQASKSDKFKVLINSSDQIDKVVADKIYRLDFVNNGLTHHTYFMKGSEIATFDLDQRMKADLILANAPKKQDLKSMSNSSKQKIKLATQLPMKLSPTKYFDDSMMMASFESQNLKSTDFTKSNFTSLSSDKPKKTKSNRTWIYIASSVLAVTLGAVLINQNNDSSRTYEPNRTQGF